MPPRLTLYPDAMLATPAEEVTAFDDKLAAVAAELVAAVETAPAIGLAGPHIGALVRLIAVRPAEGGPVEVMVNPVVASASAETMSNTEGSVSMPGITAEVVRPRAVRVAFFRLDGTAAEVEAEGFPAAVLQHEIDQLDGIFFLERLSKLRRDRLLKRWRKLG